MPLEPIRDVPRLQVLNAKASPMLSTLVSAPRLSSGGKNMKRKLTEHKGSVMSLSTNDLIGESPSPFQIFPNTGKKEIIGTVPSMQKMHPESHQRSSTVKYQLSPLAPKKLINREKLEPIGKMKLEINRVSHVENSGQQNLIPADEYDPNIGQKDPNNIVNMKLSKTSEMKDFTEEKCYDLQNEQKIQHGNVKNDWENQPNQKEMEYSDVFQNEPLETDNPSSKKNIHKLSETLYHQTEKLSSSVLTVKNLDYMNKEDIEGYEALSEKIADSKSELSLLTTAVIDKQQTCNMLESEIHALKNERSQLILKKEQLTQDMCEEYENNLKIHEEKDFLLKDIDELQIEADNIENDLDLLRTEKSKLCLELKRLKDEINEKSVELKRKPELINSEAYVSFDKIVKAEKLSNECIIPKKCFSDFSCQVDDSSSLLCTDKNDNPLHVLLNKNVGTDILFSDAFCQVEVDFCSEKKSFSEKKISTELLCSDVSCQTKDIIRNADQFVQAKPICSVKSVNTILSKVDLPSMMDICVQVSMTKSETLDAAIQTMTEVQNYALDMKHTINTRNAVDIIKEAKLELESKMTPLYQCLQFFEEALHAGNVVGDADAITSDSKKWQDMDLHQLNPVVQSTQQNIYDKNILSDGGQQSELLTTQRSGASACLSENSSFKKAKTFNPVSKETKSKPSTLPEKAKFPNMFTLVEAAEILRQQQLSNQFEVKHPPTKQTPTGSENQNVSQCILYKDVPLCQSGQNQDKIILNDSANQNMSQQYAAFYLDQNVLPTPNWNQAGMAPLSDAIRFQPLETDYKHTIALEKSSHLETETLAKAEAFLFQQSSQEKGGMSSGWIDKRFSQEYTIVHPDQNVSHAEIDGDYFQPRVVSSTDAKKGNFNPLSLETGLQNVDMLEAPSLSNKITLVKIKNLVHEMETDRLRRRLALLNSTAGHILPSLMTQEQNFSRVNSNFTLSGRISPTEFQASLSREIFMTSSHGTCFKSFVEEWKTNQDRELHELSEIRRRLHQCDKYHF